MVVGPPNYHCKNIGRLKFGKGLPLVVAKIDCLTANSLAIPLLVVTAIN